jgi:hypothetical protein
MVVPVVLVVVQVILILDLLLVLLERQDKETPVAIHQVVEVPHT